MTIREGFVLKEVAGNYVIIAIGDDVLDFNDIITVNEIGALIWNNMIENKSKGEIISVILSEYDIDEKTASEDFDTFINQLKSVNIIID